MKRENSAWMPRDPTAFSTEIKFYCVAPAAPVMCSQPCVLAGNVTFRQDRAGTLEPGLGCVLSN